MSKRKGSRYEREFAERCQDRGLVAQRVPLSGAMEGYPGDVIVADEVLVETKYRRNGTGFKRLYDWIAGLPRLSVLADGVRLRIQTLDDWCAGFERESVVWLDTRESRSSFAALRKWVGECEYLAVRMPRCEWLVIQVIEQ